MHEAEAARKPAHEKCDVHRDINPDNILINQDGDVRVTDFGLAEENTCELLRLINSGQMMGTPWSMSPEQTSGKTETDDARSRHFLLARPRMRC